MRRLFPGHHLSRQMMILCGTTKSIASRTSNKMRSDRLTKALVKVSDTRALLELLNIHLFWIWRYIPLFRLEFACVLDILCAVLRWGKRKEEEEDGEDRESNKKIISDFFFQSDTSSMKGYEDIS